MPHDIFHALGLNSNPFSPATSTRGYFHTQDTQRILEEIHFGVSNRRGFLLLIGEVGVGKTSLLLQLLDRLHRKANGALRTAWVFNTILDRVELLQAIATDFGLTPPDNASFSILLNQLHKFFLSINAAGGNCAIIVDEAHNLDGQTLESLRLLSNLESDETKLVQILLAGQPELQSRLDQQEFRQLRSRIAISNVLPPLSKSEIKRYVNFKLSSTHSQLSLPFRGSWLLWQVTRGNIRLVNLIMERALHVMYVFNGHRLSSKIVRMAIKEVAQFQRDIRIRYVRRQQIQAVLASVLLVLGLGISAQFYMDRKKEQSGKQELSALKIKQKTDQSEVGRIVKPIKHTTISSSATEEHTVDPEAVERFLAPFDLQELVPLMRKAIRIGSLDILQPNLPDDVSLVPLEKLPENSSSVKYAAFPWQETTGHGPKWVVLWRPPVHLDAYFPDYTHPEIKKVQRRLRDCGFYDLPPDGYVGSKTWRALAEFQKANGLRRTGTPTDETLFWLFAAKGKPENPNEDS